MWIRNHRHVGIYWWLHHWGTEENVAIFLSEPHVAAALVFLPVGYFIS